MKLGKDKIIEAATAFNNAKSFDEFKILLDLVNVSLEDFEHDYYEMAKVHPIFINMVSIGGKLKTFSSKSYMALDPRKILNDFGILHLSSRFKLPLWFDQDEFGTVKMTMPGGGEIAASYSPVLADDLAKLGINAEKELAQTMMVELGRV